MPNPQCEPFLPPQEYLWSCMTDPIQGGLNNRGCGLHCAVCEYQMTGGVIGVDAWGRRWARPSNAIVRGDNELEGRDAHGLYFFPNGGNPRYMIHRYTLNSHYQLGNCWQNHGVELYESPPGTPVTICDCGAGQDPRCSAEDSRRYLPGTMATCWIFHDATKVPPGGGSYDLGPHCTGALSGNDPRRFRFIQSGHYNTAVVFLGVGNRGSGCTPNVMVKCAGHAEGDGGYNCIAAGYDTLGYNTTAEDWQLFDFYVLKQSTAGFVEVTHEDVLKNRVMQYLAGEDGLTLDGFHDTHLDQLDSPRRGASFAQNSNGSINLLGRGFPEVGPLPVEILPSPVTLTGKCRRTGIPIPGELVIYEGQFVGSLMVLRIREPPDPFFPYQPPGASTNGFPHVVLKLVLKLAVRVDPVAFNAAGHTMPDGTPITIDAYQTETLDESRFVYDSPVHTPTHGFAEIFDRVEGVPDPITAVNFTIRSRADFGDPASTLTFRINGTEVWATFGGTNGEPDDDPCIDREWSFTMPAAEFAALIDHDNQDRLDLGLRFSDDIGILICPGDYITLHIDFAWDRNTTVAGPKLPTVDGGVDVIDWYLDGKYVRIPSAIEWHGEMSFESGTTPYSVVGPSGPGGNECERLAQGLTTLFVPARESHPLDYNDDKKRVYTGGVVIGLGSQN